MGPGAMVIAQASVDTVALLIVCVGAKRLGARDLGTAVAVLLLALGSLPALNVVRLQLLSLAVFAALLLLLRMEHQGPSRRVWFLVPLCVLWSNLHGAVLVGMAVATCYLLFSRMRRQPWTAVGVGLSSLFAIGVTPAGLRTGEYYVGVLTNEAARRGTDLWARPSVHEPFDVLMLISALALVAAALRRPLPLWEYAVLAGLALGTAMAARHGLWLLLWAAGPAAASLTRNQAERPTRTGRSTPGAGIPELAWGAVTGLLVCLIVAGRGNAVLPAPSGVVEAVARHARGGVVLAIEPLAESLAVAGVKVWASDPIDAFSPSDQATYLAFLAGEEGATQAIGQADIVVVRPSSPSASLVSSHARLRLAAVAEGYQIYARLP